MKGEHVTDQKLDAVRRFWDAFTREPMTLDRLRGGELDWLVDEFYPPDVVFRHEAFRVLARVGDV